MEVDPAGVEARLGLTQKLAERRYKLAGTTVRLLQVEDVSALVDAVDEDSFSDDERFPYWAEVWPSSVALADHLSRMELAPGLETLELGCGTGLAGVTAALRGCRVTFSDFSPEALSLSAANHALNLGVEPETQLIDWRKPPTDKRYPLVLAADVLYERRFLDPLVESLRSLVAAGGRALVAEPGRRIAEGTLELLEFEGFERELSLVEAAHAGKRHEIWIHELVRSVEGE